MDKKNALSKFRSNPKVEKILKFTREDKNWIYDLYDLTSKRVNHFFKINYFENKELKNDLIFFVFGNVLLTIVETEPKKYLTPVIPLRIPYEQIVESKSKKESYIGGIIPLNPYDSRRLVKTLVNIEINKYLQLARIFILWMKYDENFVREEFLALFKEKDKLEKDLKELYSKQMFNPLISEKSFSIKNNNKSRVGAKQKLSKEQFLAKFDELSLKDKKSLRSIGRALQIAPNTVKSYLKMCDIKL